MKLIDVLNKMSTIDKAPFVNILIGLIDTATQEKQKEINELLSFTDGALKKNDNNSIVKIFLLLQDDYSKHLENKIRNISTQVDFVSNILIRDGNNIMDVDWFSKLYDKEFKTFSKDIDNLKGLLAKGSSDIGEVRKRDYEIYQACLECTNKNMLIENTNSITTNEQNILWCLANELSLSQKELQLINHMIIPLKQKKINMIIEKLRKEGFIFSSRQSFRVYIPNELVVLLRRIKGREIADKHLRRILKLLTDSQINLACKNHNIDTKKRSRDEKIKLLINNGILFRRLLSVDIHKSDVKQNDRKTIINEIAKKGLELKLKGNTIDHKIDFLIEYFEKINSSDAISISQGGYEHLLLDLKKVFQNISQLIKDEFELQKEEDILNSATLLDYNIRPRDIIEILDTEMLKKFSRSKKELNKRSRSNRILNILEAYKDNEALEIENYTSIGMRDLKTLKTNGLTIDKKENLGIKFEDVTKVIFTRLGFNVDEDLRKKINTAKAKIDIVLNLGKNKIIIIECKSKEGKGYSQWSQVTRQIESYVKEAIKQGYKVENSILVAPEFTDKFIEECKNLSDFELSLMQAETLKNILKAYENSKHKGKPFSYKQFKEVMINEEDIIKSF